MAEELMKKAVDRLTRLATAAERQAAALEAMLQLLTERLPPPPKRRAGKKSGARVERLKT